MSHLHAIAARSGAVLLLGAVALAATPSHRVPGYPAGVSAKLSEWKVELSEHTIAAGTVTFTVASAGSIPHAFEVEGQGIEQETDAIQPGASATLTLTLKPGTYEVYCPVGEDSHKKLGMETDLKVVGADRVQAIRVTSGGPGIQILPGPVPLSRKAAPILRQLRGQRGGPEAPRKNRPSSGHLAP